MNYNDYYARQAGGALPYFAGVQYQRGHGLGSLFGSLLRSAMPLIKRGAVALGKGSVEDRRSHSRRRLIRPEHKNGCQTTRHRRRAERSSGPPR